MTCKRCNNELPENARFCMACGAVQPMVCPACGAESRPGSRVCSGCGKKLPTNNDNTVKFYRRKKTPGEIAAIVLLTLGALLVLTAAIMFLVGTLSDVSEKETVEQTQEVVLELEKELDVVVEDPIKRPEPEQEKEPVEEDPVETEPEVTEEEQTDDPTEEEDPAQEQEEQPEEETDAPEPEETENEEPKQEKPSVSQSEWYFPDSSERILTDADVAGLSKAELQIARNEIYARHGRKFNNPDLQAWFNSCSWYNGTIAPADFDEQAVFNATELANVYFLKEKENG